MKHTACLSVRDKRTHITQTSKYLIPGLPSLMTHPDSIKPSVQLWLLNSLWFFFFLNLSNIGSLFSNEKESRKIYTSFSWFLNLLWEDSFLWASWFFHNWGNEFYNLFDLVHGVMRKAKSTFFFNLVFFILLKLLFCEISGRKIQCVCLFVT